MKVLITGANGFIGSHLVDLLLQEGHEVKALVRTSSDLKALAGKEAELVYGDILQAETLSPAFKGCEIVFHVAGVFAYWGHQPQELIDEAGRGMRNVMAAAQNSGVRRVVVTSSSVTVGARRQPQPMTEDKPGDFESAPAYVHAKKTQEEIAFALAGKQGLEVVAVCPTLTIGAPDYGLTESNRLIVSYLSDPWHSSWIGGANIVSVEDVCAAHLLLAERGQPGERYLAGGHNLEWTAFHRHISRLCGIPGPLLTAYHTSAYLAGAFYEMISFFDKKPPITSREQARMVGNYYWYDDSKIRALGYAPRPLEDSLIAAISWLAASEHVSSAVRAQLELAPEIFAYRNRQI